MRMLVVAVLASSCADVLADRFDRDARAHRYEVEREQRELERKQNERREAENRKLDEEIARREAARPQPAPPTAADLDREARLRDADRRLAAIETERQAWLASLPPPAPAINRKLVDGRPVLGAAVVGDSVVQVAEYDDGEWRDSELLGPVEASALITASKGTPLAVGEAWLLPLRPDYRGKEGWQKLRWGMTTAEVKAAMGSSAAMKPEAPMQLAFKWVVDGSPAEVQCLFTRGRLASVIVGTRGFEATQGLLEAKYGPPKNAAFLRATWETNESAISLSMRALRPVVLYASKALFLEANAVLEQHQKKQADESL